MSSKQKEIAEDFIARLVSAIVARPEREQIEIQKALRNRFGNYLTPREEKEMHNEYRNRK